MRGQIAIELILLLVVVLVIIQASLLPFSNFARDNIEQVRNFALLKKSADSLSYNINRIALSDDNSFISLRIFLPENSEISIEGNTLHIDLNNCDKCKKDYSLLFSFANDINFSQGFYDLNIYKVGNNVQIDK